ncbi:MAG: hypothetical protein ABIS92_03620 [Polyangia bacterium]
MAIEGELVKGIFPRRGAVILCLGWGLASGTGCGGGSPGGIDGSGGDGRGHDAASEVERDTGSSPRDAASELTADGDSDGAGDGAADVAMDSSADALADHIADGPGGADGMAAMDTMDGQASDAQLDVQPGDSALDLPLDGSAADVPGVGTGGRGGTGTGGSGTGGGASGMASVCGDGLLGPNETCEGTGSLCRGCDMTPELQCLNSHLAAMPGIPLLSGVCGTLSGTAGANCWALLSCMAGGGIFACTTSGLCGGYAACCYCSDATCSAGLNGPCAAQYAAVAGTSDQALIHAQISDPTSVIARVSSDARLYWAYAVSPCAGVDSVNGYVGQLVINEVDYDQVGDDTGEFVELLNGTSAPIDSRPPSSISTGIQGALRSCT